MRITVIKDSKQFVALRDAWDTLLIASRTDSVFSTFEWLSTWWECFGKGKQLYLVCAWRDDRLVALAPMVTMQREGFRTVTLMGGPVSDYKDVLIAEDENRHEVLGLLLRHIANHSDSDLINMNGLRDDSPNFTAFQQLMPGLRAYYAGIMRYAAAPYVKIHDSWDAYWAGMSYEFRKKTNRQRAKLGEQYADINISCATSHEEVSRIVGELVALKIARWRAKGAYAVFESETVRAFYQCIAQCLFDRGLLRLYTLRAGDSIAAIDYGVEHNHKYYSCQHAFNAMFSPYSVGRLLDLHIIKEGHMNGLREIDLLLGDESYKHIYHPNTRSLYSLQMYKPGAKGRAAHTWFTHIRPRFASITKHLRLTQPVRHMTNRLKVRYG